MKRKLTLLFFSVLAFSNVVVASDILNCGNPLIPGYFADPTVKKFGDTYYIYATTDGVKLASGEPQVWMSKDFVNWYNYEIKVPLPSGLTNCWAPDIFQGPNGKYYYYMGNCQAGCNIYGYVATSPMGPFTILNGGKAVIPSGTSFTNFPSLDAQFLLDDNGSVYAYFGTWCTSFGGMGYVKIDSSNMSTILKAGKIPIAQVPNAFEAAYPFKRNGKYFLMYSSGDCRLSTYAVHYSVSDSPEGPFVPGANSPILVSSAKDSVDGPGHHSVLQEGNDYYIVYHRHDNPHSTSGEFRQVCVDKLVFTDNKTISKVAPTNKGIGLLGSSTLLPLDLAFKAKVSASSYYHLISKKTPYNTTDYNYKYIPENAVDNNNGTLWRANGTDLPQSLVIDLGVSKNIKRVTTQFEYPTYYYQYKIEVSEDSTDWQLFSDKTANRRSGCPMIDDNDKSARYVRLTITGTENSGMLAAVWNMKVYDTLFEVPNFQNAAMTTSPGTISSKKLLVDFNANSLTNGSTINNIKNAGALGGVFNNLGTPKVSWIDGSKAALLDGKSYLKLSVNAPASLAWNSSFTASVWVYNPTIENGECLMVWNSRSNMLQLSYAALMYGTGGYGAVAHGDGAVDLPFRGGVPVKAKWHHILVTFDGLLESVYVNGVLNSQMPVSLFVGNSTILIGASGEAAENFTGYIANAQLYDKALTQQEVVSLMNTTKPEKVPNPTGINDISELKGFDVRYSSESRKVSIKPSELALKGYSAKLFNLEGKEVASITMHEQIPAEIPIDTKGVYIMQITYDNKLYTQKLLIN